MRLFYQSMGVARRSRTGRYAQSLNQLLTRSAAPGTTVDVHGLSEGAAIADQYRYLESVDTQEILTNGLRAEQEGYDAFLIGNIFDPGLHELREVLNIPVLGLCESSVHLACMMGPGFSIVNVNPKFVRKVTENITGAGLEGRLVSIEHMQVERGAVLDNAFEDDTVRQMVVDQFTTAARRGIAHGADDGHAVGAASADEDGDGIADNSVNRSIVACVSHGGSSIPRRANDERLGAISHARRANVCKGSPKISASERRR